ncbi:hypothetical protein M441DRAFT_348255 [Trichoderma asperellum CBS 433.97]|uniref:Uncharacterized protein n=1 Tax=Trichoderma asperellum (strain ATCC 204424 / CBS 433.97 / NBRC 101777) TaxID=1042311 RepID=A0A2T3ZHW3_TRIA4|nr:hypothetical protein M441DRAFT_348255 [Trichoderma asperellum CBS 433.97]PTB44404.1 hypothetical protein M441DRAFT_348255 [Trichoderma asperellum CBS 433.97]
MRFQLSNDLKLFAPIYPYKTWGSDWEVLFFLFFFFSSFFLLLLYSTSNQSLRLLLNWSVLFFVRRLIRV